jgi:hypothetical protein
LGCTIFPNARPVGRGSVPSTSWNEHDERKRHDIYQKTEKEREIARPERLKEIYTRERQSSSNLVIQHPRREWTGPSDWIQNETVVDYLQGGGQRSTTL